MEPIDAYIGKRIKRFANRYSPPVNGRNRLLRAASSNALKAGSKPGLRLFPDRIVHEKHHTTDWPFVSADWPITNYFRLESLILHHVL
jgi:hypothetical protein